MFCLSYNPTNFYAKVGPSGVEFKGPLWHPIRYLSDTPLTGHLWHPINAPNDATHQKAPLLTWHFIRALANGITLNMFILVPIFYWNIFKFRKAQDLITGRN